MSSTRPCPNPTRRALLAGALALGAAPCLPARAQAIQLGTPIRFGILPIGGTVDSRNGWAPVLAELGQAIGRPVTLLSATSYNMLEQALRRDEVDMAFLSGKMALDAVMQRGMRVIAQVARHDGLPGYRATLLARSGGPVPSLDAVLANPGKWRLARGEKRSLSGFIVPKLELFLPRGIDIETSFAGGAVGTHQQTALAVANGEAELATNNTADFERFNLVFPAEAARLTVLWQSDLIPHGAIVIRRGYDGALRERVQQFFWQYGRGRGRRAEQQRQTLKALHDFAGFPAADNRALIPVARLTHKLELDSARSAQWINEAARQARLARIDSEYAEQLRALQAE